MVYCIIVYSVIAHLKYRGIAEAKITVNTLLLIKMKISLHKDIFEFSVLKWRGLILQATSIFLEKNHSNKEIRWEVIEPCTTRLEWVQTLSDLWCKVKFT